MIGVDIIQTSRMENLIKKERFFLRTFTSNELKYIEERNGNLKTIAGFFAAKEAVSKAFGVGISKELNLKDIEILHSEKGAPYINSTNLNIKVLMEKQNVIEIGLSISHDGEYTVAVCYLRKSDFIDEAKE